MRRRLLRRRATVCGAGDDGAAQRAEAGPGVSTLPCGACLSFVERVVSTTKGLDHIQEKEWRHEQGGSQVLYALRGGARKRVHRSDCASLCARVGGDEKPRFPLRARAVRRLPFKRRAAVTQRLSSTALSL